MRQSAARFPLLLSLYRVALRLYPPEFRIEFGGAMSRTLEDCLCDRSVSRKAILYLLFIDLWRSIGKEHLVMMTETLRRPMLAFNAFVLAGIATILALFLYAIPQQVLRQGANDPQLEIAGNLAARLEEGAAPADVVPAAKVDMTNSLSPFVIVYDDRGRPLASQALLDGKEPVPPQGVFDYVRQHREERLSWQPVLGAQHPVRVAAVVLRVQHAGSGGAGFVLAGRSLRQVEERVSQVSRMAFVAWLAMLALIAAGTIGAGWMMRPRPSRTAA